MQEENVDKYLLLVTRLMQLARYDTHRQSIVLTMWPLAENVDMTYNTDEDLPELSINHKVML